MSSYLADHRILVFPFTQKPDGNETIIANASGSVFLSLPSSAVDILTWLEQEKTVGETQALYMQKYGEVPDIEDFLALLESEGFVSSKAAMTLNIDMANMHTEKHTTIEHQYNIKKYHFEFISQEIARHFFAGPILLGSIILIGLALVLVVLDPSVIPSPQVLVFKQNLTLMSIGLYLFVFVTIFSHEMAHLLAARAAGVPAQLGISHRLWILVAQTDMTGIWMAPRRQRYLAVLAGPFLDAVFAAILIILLFTYHHGWISTSPIIILFCKIALFAYLMRILWECCLFVRTDFYYFLSILFNCKNLMGDTETLLLNLCARFFPFIQRVDQSNIPQREMRFIRIYSFLWFFGRIAAFISLFLITIPILVGYYQEIGIFLFRGQIPRSLTLPDVAGWIILIGMPIILQTAGFTLWIRSLYLTRRKKNANLAR